MIEIHTTEDGKALFISQTEDSHLLNTIHMKLSKLDQFKKAMDTKINIDPAAAAMYGINTKQISNKAKGAIQPMIRSLYPYLSEAALRGIDIKAPLQLAMGREGKEARFIDTEMALHPKGNRRKPMDKMLTPYDDSRGF